MRVIFFIYFKQDLNIMSLNSIKNNFLESKQLLDQFVNNESNLLKIAEAGKLMTSSIAGGGKIISCGNGGSM